MHRVTLRPRIALVGCGAWGRNLARALHDTGHLACIYDADAAARAQAQSLCPGVPVQAHWEPTVPEIDAVAVATPAPTHVPLAQQALACGKDVFVEKPMALDVAAAEALAHQASLGGRLLMVGHLLVYHPALDVVQQVLAAGGLGSLRRVGTRRHNFGVIRHAEDALWSLGPHDVAVILWLLQDMPQSLWAYGHSDLQPGRVDACTLHLTFAAGVQTTVSLSWLHPVKEQQLIVQGTGAALVLDDVAKALHLQPLAVGKDGTGRPTAQRQPATRLPFSTEPPLAAQCTAFVRALTDRRPPRTDGHSGAAVVRVLAAASTSLAAGGQVVPL